MKNFIIYILSILALTATSCGHSDTFRIEGELSDGSTINLRILYYSDGAVISGITASKDGKFHYESNVSNKSLIEFYDNDYRLLGRVVASPGDDIKVKLNPSNPYLIEAEGNETTQQWSKFLSTNAELLQGGKADVKNDLVADYVKKNPDNSVSELLMMTEFNAGVPGGALRADSLLNLISEDVREKGFSTGFAQIVERVGEKAAQEKVMPIPYRKSGNITAIFKPSDKPYNLIAFTDERSSRDTISPHIGKLVARQPAAKLGVIELSLDMDTVVWARTLRGDSAKWTRGWVAGSISARGVDRLGLPELPYFIVADSAGRQLWRGRSISAAYAKLETLLKR